MSVRIRMYNGRQQGSKKGGSTCERVGSSSTRANTWVQGRRGKGAARYMGVRQTVRGCDSKREGREDAGCMGAGARERAGHPRGGKKGREKRGGEKNVSLCN